MPTRLLLPVPLAVVELALALDERGRAPTLVPMMATPADASGLLPTDEPAAGRETGREPALRLLLVVVLELELAPFVLDEGGRCIGGIKTRGESPRKQKQ